MMLILFVFLNSIIAYPFKQCDIDYDYPTQASITNEYPNLGLSYYTHFKRSFYKGLPNQLILDVSKTEIGLAIKGGSICQCKESLHYQLTPSSPKVFLYFINKDSKDTIFTDTFMVRLRGLHDVHVTFNGKEYSQKNPVFGFSHWKTASIVASWPTAFRKAFPKEFFVYKVTDFDFLLVRGLRPIDKIDAKGSEVDISEMMAKSKTGDRLIINAYMQRVDQNGNLRYMSCGVLYNYYLGEKKP